MGTRYDGLTDFLAGRTEPVVELTFSDLDRLVSGGLPDSARVHAAWWANSTASQPHSRAWLSAGRQAKPDFGAGRVRFPLGSEHRLGRSPADRPAPAPPTEAPVGETLVGGIHVTWFTAGPVTAGESGLIFPIVPARPGVYRFHLHGPPGPDTVYVGESDHLPRRMGNYRTPGPTQPTNQRMQARISAVLASGGTVTVETTTSAMADGIALDLAHRPARLLVENAALLHLGRHGTAIENL